MCNKVVKLAKQSKFKWIGVCEHGTAHLFCDTARVYFPLPQLKQMMKQASEGKLSVELYGAECLIWFEGLAIKLDEQGYIEMLNLFARAAESYLARGLQNKKMPDNRKVLGSPIERPPNASLH